MTVEEQQATGTRSGNAILSTPAVAGETLASHLTRTGREREIARRRRSSTHIRSQSEART